MKHNGKQMTTKPPLLAYPNTNTKMRETRRGHTLTYAFLWDKLQTQYS